MSIDYDNPYIFMQYSTLLEKLDKNDELPSQDIIAFILVHTKPELLTFREISFKEHIWYLFQYACEVHNHFDDGSAYWEKRFIELVKDGFLDKEKFLQETLLTTTRFSNHSITNYFFRILDNIELDNNILLNQQDTLFLVLQSQHSKPINQTLKYLKRIHKEPNFDVEGFMEKVPLLLSWSVKAVVNATLGLINVLIKAYPTHKEELAILATQALAQEEESLQTKTIKLLAKHKLLETPSILDEIAIYSEGLYHSTKQLLPELEAVTTKEETIEITPPQHIREDNRIIYPESFDEMVFFFSQVFEGNNVYDFELFVVLLPKLYLKITPENIFKLEPAFQKAFKYHTTPPDYKYLEIIDLLAQVFLYFGHNFLPPFNIIYEKLEKNYLNKFNSIESKTDIKNWLDKRFKEFDFNDKTVSICNTYYEIIVHTFDKIKQNIHSDSLCLSTHTPCWIEAKVLEERLKIAQNIHPFELQIALSKTIFDIQYIIRSKNEEIDALLLYLQTKDMTLPIDRIKNPEYWITPLLRKNNYDDLKKFAKEFQKEQHDIPFSHILKGSIIHKNSNNTTFYSHCIQLIRTLSFTTIYHYTRIFTDNDLPYVLALIPTLPNFILEARYKTPQTNFEVMMPMLIEIWGDYGENNYLFHARTLTDTSKTTRQLASELWHKATLEGSMNHQLLGEILGKLEYNEYAPLKRFTDLVVSNMLNLSTLHNQGLHSLLSAMIANMHDEPIKGTMKLLEIYLEMLSLTELGMPSETMEKLEAWGEVKSLKSVVKKVLKG